MIHCVCNNINTARVDEAARKGAETPVCVMRACNTKFNCGQCRSDIAEQLKKIRAANALLEAAE